MTSFFDLPTDALADQLVLDQLKVGITEAVGPTFAQSVRIQTRHDPMLDRMVCRLTAQVLAEKLPPRSVSETVTVTWPQWATWRDHFKATHAARWWMRWWARRRPARTVEGSRKATVTVDLQRYITYPRASIALPEFGKPVRISISQTWTNFGRFE